MLVRAKTEFKPEVGPVMLFESFKGITSELISYDSHVEINYYVSVPEYINLRIDNKYGDIYMESISGDCYVILSNGSLKANSLEGEATIELAFLTLQSTLLVPGRLMHHSQG